MCGKFHTGQSELVGAFCGGAWKTSVSGGHQLESQHIPDVTRSRSKPKGRTLAGGKRKNIRAGRRGGWVTLEHLSNGCQKEPAESKAETAGTNKTGSASAASQKVDPPPLLVRDEKRGGGKLLEDRGRVAIDNQRGDQKKFDKECGKKNCERGVRKQRSGTPSWGKVKSLWGHALQPEKRGLVRANFGKGPVEKKVRRNKYCLLERRHAALRRKLLIKPGTSPVSLWKTREP